MVETLEADTPFRPVAELLERETEAEAQRPRRPAGPLYPSIVSRDVLAAAGLSFEAGAEAEEAEETDGLEEQEILGADGRRPVTDATDVPYRFICAIDMLYRIPGNPNAGLALRGSGTMITDRHVLTAAHNVLDDVSRRPDAAAAGIPAGRIRPNAILVTPGRHGTAHPFGVSTAATVRVAPDWQATADNQSDFALITLRHRLGAIPRKRLGGKPLGYWGHKDLGGGTRILPTAPDRLLGRSVNTAGYPIDKCLSRPIDRAATAAEIAACAFINRGSAQFRSTGRVTQSPPAGMARMFAHDLDTAAGQSGSPTWVRWQDYRNLVGVHSGGLPADIAPFSIIASLDVRITEDLLTQLRTWIRADRVDPTF